MEGSTAPKGAMANFSSLRAHLDAYLQVETETDTEDTLSEYQAPSTTAWKEDHNVQDRIGQQQLQQMELQQQEPANMFVQQPSTNEVLTLESLRGLSPPDVRRVLSQSGSNILNQLPQRPAPLKHSESKDSLISVVSATDDERDDEVQSEPYQKGYTDRALTLSITEENFKALLPTSHRGGDRTVRRNAGRTLSEAGEPKTISSHNRADSIASTSTERAADFASADTTTTVNIASLANLSYDMKRMLAQPELCDVSFVVGTRMIKVMGVRAVLAARSKRFKTMLYGIKTKHQREFFLPLEDGPAFKKMVKFIHTGKVSIEPATCDALLATAQKYELSELVRVAAEYLENSINIETVVAKVNAAYEAQDTDLCNRCLRFFETNASKIFKTSQFQSGALLEDVFCLLLKADQLVVENEMEVYRAVVQWGRAIYSRGLLQQRMVKRKVCEIIKKPIALVRFGFIPINVIMREIANEALVPTSVLLEAVAHQTDPSSIPGNGPMFKPRVTKKSNLWLTWDDTLKDSELQVTQDRTSVTVVPGITTNRPRNIISAVPLDRGSHRWRIRVEGPTTTSNIFVCLGVMTNSTNFKINPFCAKEICSFSSCMNIYGHRISGAPISLENGAIAELVLNMEKHVLYVKKEGATQYDMRLRVRSGPCRLFASLISSGSKITLLPY